MYPIINPNIKMQNKRDYLGLAFVRVRFRLSLTSSYIDILARSAFGYFVRHNTGPNVRTALEGLLIVQINSMLIHSSAIFAYYLNMYLHSKLQNHIRTRSRKGKY